MSVERIMHLAVAVCLVIVWIYYVPADARRRRSYTQEVSVVGVDGMSIVLHCSLPRSSVSTVKWVDKIYNTDPAKPQLIFTTVDNPNLQVDLSHPMNEYFTVDANLSLTISSLKIGESAGQYICQYINGELRELIYDLTIVVQKPKCSGEIHLNAATSELMLTCELPYSGNQQPSLNWFRKKHTRHQVFDPHTDDDIKYGEIMLSVDELDIREIGPVARKVVHKTHAQASDDEAIYTCRMTLEGIDESCQMKLNVTYLVRDLKLKPDSKELKVGDTVTCHARGNPTPEITLIPSSPDGSSGAGWQSFVIGPDLHGQQVQVRCTATNKIGETTETLTVEQMIQVEEYIPYFHEPVPRSTNLPTNDASSGQYHQPAVVRHYDVLSAETQEDQSNSGNVGRGFKLLQTVLFVLLSALILT
jgi:hypothetical protein